MPANQKVSAGAGDEEFVSTEPNYKPDLDAAADQAKGTGSSRNEDEGTGSSILDRASQYVPASVGKLFASGKDGEGEGNEGPAPETQRVDESESGTVPLRPHHDPQIQEFVRDQHRSNKLTEET
ncbi:hypothetical protein VTK73DRAFT_3832 [Phialemonium thermophilum]|uniref:Uncharacterized protein n=1 Tax=Phialemonium thermophilum TaxID=223376 RepID=A0ABR3WWU1_9PEZI